MSGSRLVAGPLRANRRGEWRERTLSRDAVLVIEGVLLLVPDLWRETFRE